MRSVAFSSVVYRSSNRDRSARLSNSGAFGKQAVPLPSLRGSLLVSRSGDFSTMFDKLFGREPKAVQVSIPVK